MQFLIEPYIHKRTEELSFVNLSPEALQIKGYKIPKEGLYVPIFTKSLADNIKSKTEDEIITSIDILKGMTYLLGIDSKFKHKEEYIKFMYAINPEIEKQINQEAIRLYNEDKLMESLISSKALIILNENSPEYLLNYAIALINYTEKHLKDKQRTRKIFIKETIICLETILKIDSKFALAYYHLGFLYVDKKQFDKAKDYWKVYLKIDDNNELKQEVTQLLLAIEDEVNYEKGCKLVLEGNATEGLRFLLQLEEKYPQWWNLMFVIGLAYRQLAQYKEAIKYFKEVLKLENNQLDTISELGLIYASTGEFTLAIENFEKILSLNGENSEVLCNMAMVYMEMGELEIAGEHLKRSLTLDKEDEITKICVERLNDLLKNQG